MSNNQISNKIQQPLIDHENQAHCPERGDCFPPLARNQKEFNRFMAEVGAAMMIMDFDMFLNHVWTEESPQKFVLISIA